MRYKSLKLSKSDYVQTLFCFCKGFVVVKRKGYDGLSIRVGVFRDL